MQEKDICLKLMNEYFNDYKSAATEENIILSDYKVVEVRDVKNTMTGFTFRVVYSVKPVSSNSDWVAGNGEITTDGWIKDKYTEVTVIKQGDKYIIKNMGIA